MTDFNLLWATPIMRIDTEKLDLADRLRELILSRETDEYRKENSPQRHHDNLFESNFDFLTWKEPVITEFKEVYLGYLGNFVKLVNDLDDAQLNELRFDSHVWYHIARDGGYFQPHNHPNASWSAIFCVDPGDEEPKNDSMAGQVMFTDPRQTNAFLDPANRNMRRDMSFNAIRFRLKPAQICIFPSYLYHYVEPYIGERPRITIAGNFWFRLA